LSKHIGKKSDQDAKFSFVGKKRGQEPLTGGDIKRKRVAILLPESEMGNDRGKGGRGDGTPIHIATGPARHNTF